MSRKPTSLFLTFEGIEGCGKSTQIGRLVDRLRAAGRQSLLTREPGGTELGRRLRALLLDPGGASISPIAELLLYVADRAQHLTEIVGPALDRGEVVLCDRYLDATVAYQGYARGLGAERILALHREPPLDLRPDRTILLDLHPTHSLERARLRNADSGADIAEGRFELEDLEFHRRVRQGYLALAAAEPRRIVVVDAAGEPDDVEQRLQTALGDLLPELEAAS